MRSLFSHLNLDRPYLGLVVLEKLGHRFAVGVWLPKIRRSVVSRNMNPEPNR